MFNIDYWLNLLYWFFFEEISFQDVTVFSSLHKHSVDQKEKNICLRLCLLRFCYKLKNLLFALNSVALSQRKENDLDFEHQSVTPDRYIDRYTLVKSLVLSRVCLNYGDRDRVGPYRPSSLHSDYSITFLSPKSLLLLSIQGKLT